MTSRRDRQWRDRDVDPVIVRVAWLLMALQRRDGVTCGEFQQRFGVALRTFRRDLDAIRASGMVVSVPMGRGYGGESNRYRCVTMRFEAEAG